MNFRGRILLKELERVEKRIKVLDIKSNIDELASVDIDNMSRENIILISMYLGRILKAESVNDIDVLIDKIKEVI